VDLLFTESKYEYRYFNIKMPYDYNVPSGKMRCGYFKVYQKLLSYTLFRHRGFSLHRPNSASATFSSIRKIRVKSLQLASVKNGTAHATRFSTQCFYSVFITSLGNFNSWRYVTFLKVNKYKYREIFVGAGPTVWNFAIDLILKINIAMLFLGKWPTGSLCPS